MEGIYNMAAKNLGSAVNMASVDYVDISDFLFLFVLLLSLYEIDYWCMSILKLIWFYKIYQRD